MAKSSKSLRSKLHDIVSQLPELSSTNRDSMWAGMATQTLSESVVTSLPAKAMQQDADAAQGILDGLRALSDVSPEMAKAMAEQVKEAEIKVEDSIQELMSATDRVDESVMRNSLRAGFAKAQEEIEQAKETLAAFGYGTSVGSMSQKNIGTARELAKKVASSDRLKKIVAMAGRITMTARAKRANKTQYAQSETVGIERKGWLSRFWD